MPSPSSGGCHRGPRCILPLSLDIFNRCRCGRRAYVWRRHQHLEDLNFRSMLFDSLLIRSLSCSISISRRRGSFFSNQLGHLSSIPGGGGGRGGRILFICLFIHVIFLDDELDDPINTFSTQSGGENNKELSKKK